MQIGTQRQNQNVEGVISGKGRATQPSGPNAAVGKSEYPAPPALSSPLCHSPGRIPAIALSERRNNRDEMSQARCIFTEPQRIGAVFFVYELLTRGAPHPFRQHTYLTVRLSARPDRYLCTTTSISLFTRKLCITVRILVTVTCSLVESNGSKATGSKQMCRHGYLQGAKNPHYYSGKLYEQATPLMPFIFAFSLA